MPVSWMEGLTTAGASAENPSSAWLRFRAGPGAAKISLQPGLCAQTEATCPQHIPMLLFWRWQRPRHIQPGHSTVQLIRNHPVPQFPLLSGGYSNPKLLWGLKGVERGIAKPCSHGPWFSSITSAGLFLISVFPGRDQMTGEPRSSLAARHALAEDAAIRTMVGGRCCPSLHLHLGVPSHPALVRLISSTGGGCSSFRTSLC